MGFLGEQPVPYLVFSVEKALSLLRRVSPICFFIEGFICHIKASSSFGRNLDHHVFPNSR